MLGKHSKIRIQNKLAMSTQLVFCYLRINDVSCLMRRLLPRSKKGMRSRPNPKVRSVWHYFVISLSPSVGGKEVIIIFSMRIPSRPATMEELPHTSGVFDCRGHLHFILPAYFPPYVEMPKYSFCSTQNEK